MGRMSKLKRAIKEMEDEILEHKKKIRGTELFIETIQYSIDKLKKIDTESRHK